MDNKYKNIEKIVSKEDPFFSPSDKVWESINNDLFKKKKRRSFLWLVPFVLMFGLSFIIIGNILFKSSVDSNISLGYLETNPTVNKDRLPSYEQSNLKSEPPVVENTSYSEKNKRTNQVNTSYTSSKTSYIKSTSIAVDNSPLVDTDLPIENNAIRDKVIDINMITPAKSSEITDFSPLSYLQSSKLDLIKYDGNNGLVPYSIITTDKEKKDYNPYIVSPMFSHNLNATSGRIDQNGVENLVSSDYSSRYTVELLIGKQYGNWVLGTGLGYSNGAVNSRYDLHIPYNKNTEYHDPSTSQYINDFSHSLPTASGNIGTELSLRRSDITDIEHNADINVELEVSERYDIVSLPVFARYVDDSGLFGQFNVTVNYLANDKVKENKLVSHHDFVHLNDFSLQIEDTRPQLFFGLSTIIGYEHRITPRLSISAFGGYQVNFNGIGPSSSIPIGLGASYRID